MQEDQKESQKGRTETLPRTVHKTVAEEEVAAVADNEEAWMLVHQSSAADVYVCSLKSQESWSSAETPGHLAGFYQFQPPPVVLQTAHAQKVDSQRP